MNFKRNDFLVLEDEVINEVIGGVNPLVLLYLGMLGGSYSKGYSHGKDLAKNR